MGGGDRGLTACECLYRAAFRWIFWPVFLVMVCRARARRCYLEPARRRHVQNGLPPTRGRRRYLTLERASVLSSNPTILPLWMVSTRNRGVAHPRSRAFSILRTLILTRCRTKDLDVIGRSPGRQHLDPTDTRRAPCCGSCTWLMSAGHSPSHRRVSNSVKADGALWSW
jgi:hypothetical protein